jgi:hypothetical protein
MFDSDREAFESLLSQVTTEIPSQIRRDFQSAEADLGFSVSDVELPEKKQPFLQAAIHARASHLLTGDKQHVSQYFGRPLAAS